MNNNFLHCGDKTQVLGGTRGEKKPAFSELAAYSRTAQGARKEIQVGWVFIKLYAAGYVAEADVKSLNFFFLF